jgi:hypothetical protein
MKLRASQRFLFMNIAGLHDPGKRNAFCRLVHALVIWKFIRRSTHSIFAERRSRQAPDFGQVFQRWIFGALWGCRIEQQTAVTRRESRLRHGQGSDGLLLLCLGGATSCVDMLFLLCRGWICTSCSCTTTTTTTSSYSSTSSSTSYSSGDLIATERTFEIVPASMFPAPVTHVGAATNRNVKFIEICGQSFGWFGTKGAFLQDHVLGLGLGILCRNSLLVAVVENDLLGDIQVVVLADKDLATDVLMIPIE